MCEGLTTWHKCRRAIQTNYEKGIFVRRVKHKNFNKAAKSGKKWSYNGPVYEYRYNYQLD